ncbi:MAG: hypothetical protein WBE13_19225 [Candidatus Acidiferrum sp.]
MKTRILIAIAMVALVVAFAYTASAPAAPNAANANALPAPAPQPHAAAATPAPEPHPEIHAAIDSLRHAREHLDHAAHDFGGHRVEAIRAIDNAISQLQICLKYDR